jgi:hypothetical protein
LRATFDVMGFQDYAGYRSFCKCFWVANSAAHFNQVLLTMHDDKMVLKLQELALINGHLCLTMTVISICWNLTCWWFWDIWVFLLRWTQEMLKQKWSMQNMYVWHLYIRNICPLNNNHKFVTSPTRISCLILLDSRNSCNLPLPWT